MNAMKGPLERLHLSESHRQSPFPKSDPARFQSLLDSVASDPGLPSSSLGADLDVNMDEKDGILSQDFFCTPDYITPENQNTTFTGFDCSKDDDIPCPKSLEKTTVKSKRRRQGQYVIASEPALSPTLFGNQEMGKDAIGIEDIEIENTAVSAVPKATGYVSQSAVALRCRVMPPPCFRNPYTKDASQTEIDPFGNQRSKCAAFLPALRDGNGMSRYRADFHEIEQIGRGNFSHVFKVLNRIDGCLYAVKQSIRQLPQDTERRKALMEVQCLASLGPHANIVGYYTSWFENEKLYIQMELCDHSLCVGNFSSRVTEEEVLVVLFQIAKALQFMHERGIAHLDIKPDNIYVKNSIFKLGDFGCATLLDQSLPIEEGDARYMPSEVLNEKHDYLDKADIFSLGVAMYELIRGSPLLVEGPLISNLKKGKLPLLPGRTLQFQNLLKAMLDPSPVCRPSAQELVGNSIFHRVRNNAWA